LFGRPTVVDNVETLVNVPWIVRHGPDRYRALGTPSCPGTKALCLNHGFKRPGIVEIDFGVPLERVIHELAGGSADGETLNCVLLGGPMGSFVARGEWDVAVCIDEMSRRGVRLGHGGIVAIPADADRDLLLRHMLEFMAEESCGGCVPCSLGTRRAFELAQAGASRAELARTLPWIFDVMERASLCGFGRETPGPVRQLLAGIGDAAHSGGDLRP
jgi:NADH:ubiquinone oxidoreductase subunit F (NADH-binding)